MREEEPENVIASSLAKMTTPRQRRNGQKGSNGLYGGDLEVAAAIIKTVANRIRYLLQTQSGNIKLGLLS